MTLILRTAIQTAIAFALTACSNIECSPFVFDRGRLISRLDSAEIAEAHRRLESVTDDNVPQQMAGGIVIDGRVVGKMPLDKFGQAVYQVWPEHVYLGNDQMRSGPILLVSPTKINGGIELSLNSKYRIFAIRLDDSSDLFYVWNGTALLLHD